jgi:hypothetical protein
MERENLVYYGQGHTFLSFLQGKSLAAISAEWRRGNRLLFSGALTSMEKAY